MTTFFTSDLHILHRKIVEFTDRKIVTTQEHHEEWLIDLWNSQVNRGDIVYILGDVSFAKDWMQTKAVFDRMHGQKFIVKGNHDRSKDLKFLLDSNTIVGWKQYDERNVNKQHICMFHFPIMSWHRQNRGSWHLHGHSHGNLQGSVGKMLDVGIDSSYNIYGEHRLFSFEDVSELMQDRQIVIADYHRNS